MYRRAPLALGADQLDDRDDSGRLLLVLRESRVGLRLLRVNPVTLATFDGCRRGLVCSDPTSTVTVGFATRLWYQSGFVGAPAFDAKTYIFPSPGRYIIGVV